MSSARNGRDDGEGYEVGRGAAGRKKIIGLIVGVILAAFVVMLLIWLLGSGSDSSEGAPAVPAAEAEAVLTSG